MLRLIAQLEDDQKKVVERADRSEIAAALGRLSISPDGRWIKTSNPYLADPEAELKADGYSVPAAKYDSFAEYVAAGAFSHCGDGWGYLGRAVDSLLKGDLETAVHLTYYAELRAALSLLATEGIYVGNLHSFALTGSQSAELILQTGTHNSAWKCLAAWNESSRSQSLLGDVLRPGNTTLSVWSTQIPVGGIGPIISDLLEKVAFELGAFSVDKNRRNSASYSPSRIAPTSISAAKVRGIISRLWSSLDPDSAGGFPLVDTSLIQSILLSTYAAVHPALDEDGLETGQTDWTAWERWLEQVVPNSSYGSAFHESLIASGLDEGATNPMGAAFGSDLDLEDPSDFIESMMTRTTVMLRIATGSCLQLVSDAGVSRSELKPWVDSLASARGLWEDAQPPDDVLDLWLDAEDARITIDSLSGDDRRSMLSALGFSATLLGQTERVVAWSFSA